ncbi:MAG: TetR/AcrR family transcriptional regulator [Puia sp.]|nr:TetR/AcrR family transcriptional regulator [Puia sp.]
MPPSFIDNSRERIIYQAIGLFRTLGFQGTSIRDLANASNLETASLYSHFRSKEEILREICVSVSYKIETHMLDVDAGQKSKLEELEGFMQRYMELLRIDPDRIYIYEHEAQHVKEPTHSYIQKKKRDFRSRLTSLLQEGVDRGEIRAVDPETTTVAILAGLRAIENWHNAENDVFEKAAKNIIKYLLRGIRIDAC